MITTVSLPTSRSIYPFIFTCDKYGLETEILAGNQVEIVGTEEKVGFVLKEFPATIIHKERHKLLGRGES